MTKRTVTHHQDVFASTRKPAPITQADVDRVFIKEMGDGVEWLLSKSPQPSARERSAYKAGFQAGWRALINTMRTHGITPWSDER